MLQTRIYNLCNRLIGNFAGAFAPTKGEAGVFAPAHVAGVRPASQRTINLLKWLWTALFIICLAPLQAVSATNQIINTATLNTAEYQPSSCSATAVKQTGRTSSTIEFLKYAPGIPGAVSNTVGQTWYTDASGTFVPLNPPVTVGTIATINLSLVPLIKTAIYHAGEPLFVRVTDPDQNLDKNLAETVFVTLTDPKTGDTEILKITETGPNTGIFIGYIQTASATTGLANKGILSVSESSPINVLYVDIADPTDSSTDTAMVDPFGIVFDSMTGKPIDGATVELLNADGSAATVYGDNGLPSNSYPNKIVSGGTALDHDNNTYAFAPGGYRFPFVNPGNYIIKITPPKTYIAPSTATTKAIQILPGAPFAILEPGSRGEVFSVPSGPAIRVDIPLDPKIGTLWLSKNSGKSVVSAGEHLSYDITLENSSTVGTIFSPVVTDILPPGFRFEKGSVKINGISAPDPAISRDGSSMTFTLANISPSTNVTLRYVVAVGAGAKTGSAENIAFATAAGSIRSNIAKASVLVQEAFMQSRSIIMGRVSVGVCSEENKKGMPGIGIFMEDGTFVISDKLGMFHFEGVRPGTHVIQLDLDSIPQGYKILPCEENSRFAGRAYSQFVDMQGGSMWRTDFYLGKDELKAPLTTTSIEKIAAVASNSITAPQPEQKGEVTLEMISSQNEDIIDYRLPLNAHTIAVKNLKMIVKLPMAATYIPGSSSLNGAALNDPEISGATLTYQLGDSSDKLLSELQLRTRIDKNSPAGELQTRASLRFDTATAANNSTPEVINTLSLTKSDKFIELPLFIMRPHFPTFAAELGDMDRLELDRLVDKLSGKVVKRIDVTGHTDNIRIAPKSRDIYADNSALSLARAKSVGRYLTSALHLPPSALFLNGSADSEPIAPNSSESGRALNRRVEVRITAVERVEIPELKITREHCGIEKVETTTATPSTMSADEPQSLTPPPVKNSSETSQAAANTTQSQAAPEVRSKVPTDRAAQPITERQNSEEHVKLYSAINDGIVHYRVKLVNSKEPINGVTTTLVTPKSFLYMTGTSRLASLPTIEPNTAESVINYSFPQLKDENIFDLRLQALMDGDDKNEALASSVTVVIIGKDGKPLKTLTAAADLIDSMDEINREDAPITAPTPVTPDNKDKERKEIADQVNEYAEKIPVAGEPTKTETAPVDAGLHVRDEEGILSPFDSAIVATRINPVRIVLNSDLTPVLSIDGKEIAAERIGFSMKDKDSGKSLYTYIGVDFGEEGEHTLQLKGLDSFNFTRLDRSAKITRTGEIASIRFVSGEGNIADGKTPVKVRVQLFDKFDKPVPASAELIFKGGDLKAVSSSESYNRVASANSTVTVSNDGWISFAPVNSSGIYKAQLSYNKAEITIETYVKPMMRNWLLVGLAEGTVGYNTVSGHMENLKSSGEEDHLYEKDRVALYAKGTIKGEWLLTMAYDNAKKNTGIGSNGLFQTIDPNSYYTIYGDSSAQMYDAASQRKLYLKIERDQFYALFGDYDTGLTVSELSRYSRRMNGIKSEYHSRDYDATVFGSETGQSFAKDEIRGDGTSGLYRLSKNGIVINSEKVIIETRDRFHSEVVTSSNQMNRFTDYSIDYDNGTIFFKSPVSSRDDQLNPIYIVVDYEIKDAGKNALTYGGHASARMMNGKVQVGGTYIHEGHLSGSGNLYGADATAILAPGTKARAEFATSSDDTGTKRSGNAYLAEVTHNGKQFDGKAYYREQEDGFGLGQQKASEAGTRKFGVEGAYRPDKNITINSQAYRQYTLLTGASRDFMEGLLAWNEKQYTVRTGLRYASDTLQNDSKATSLLGTVGASWKSFDQKLTLHADHDQALFSKNENADFPTRTVFGADYQMTRTVMIFAQEELTYGTAANTNTTRVGLKSTPWSGATLNSSFANDIRENGDRTFANVGLTQKWQINPHWMVDGSLDHSESIRKNAGYSLNPAVPPSSGGEDFTAVSLGGNYTEKSLTWSNRAEYRNSRTDDKWGITSGLINEQGLNWGWTAKLQLLHTQSTTGNSKTDADLRFGLAYRPPVTKWIVLDRLDLVTSDEKTAVDSTKGKRIVNNLNANYKPDRNTQLSIQYGAKYVLEKIDEKEYSGYTDLVGIEGRYNINKEWDLGLRSSILHTWATSQFVYSFGPSIGYNVMDNAWISLGYNFAGFKDKDFSAANYTAEGPFVQFRFKFDQNSIKDGLKMLNQ